MLNNNYAYTASGTRIMYVINISDPNNPSEIEYIDMYWQIREIVVNGSYVM